MQQPHINITGIKHNEKVEKQIKTIQTQSKNIIHPHIQGAPIKNNPLENMLYFSHGSMDLSQTFRFFMRIFTTQDILRILLKYLA